MQRILVLGSSGSGKSTFSRQLGQLLGVEIIHLDSHYWQPNWAAASEKEWAKKLEQLLQKPGWIMDGNYPSSLDLRLSFADTVVFLDRQRLLCLWRCVKRLLRNWGRNRQELAPGCDEKIDGEFLKWIWNYPKDVKPVILEQLHNSAAAGSRQIFILRNNGAIADFLEDAAKGATQGASVMPSVR
jgi:adenylate kinase family enzyme